MNREVFFYVQSHGYEMRKDGFGYAGVTLVTTPGTRGRISLHRVNIAERLYRLTGEGRYRDTLLLGEKPPLQSLDSSGSVLGQDSVMAAVFGDRIYWFWGDTNRAAHPLGNFRTSGATSALPGAAGTNPDIGIQLDYFLDDRRDSRSMCPDMGDGPVWIDGLVVVPDGDRQRMVCHYRHMQSLEKVLDHGLLDFVADSTPRFEALATFDLRQTWQCPSGQALRQTIDGVDYLLFSSPVPNVRVRADFASVRDPRAYEAFTCFDTKDANDPSPDNLQRDADGRLLWSWRHDAPPVGPAEERRLVASGKMRADEARFQPRDEAGNVVQIHASAVHWNAYHRQWVMIAEQMGGTSLLGEIWFATADVPTGPWTWARKIVTHDDYTFYNPAYHDFFDRDGGRFIYFEGTYTRTFSGNDDPTPRYDYNQIMYRLDMADPRLNKE
ncbi:MAG TPA: hypothetical protein VHV77_06025, partial [Pirellulales bacterium]|nr:hypothetical protein [Pirellulales bacterium]